MPKQVSLSCSDQSQGVDVSSKDEAESLYIYMQVFLHSPANSWYNFKCVFVDELPNTETV